jgi:hypothetical protein
LYVDTGLNTKADQSTTYTKTEVNTLTASLASNILTEFDSYTFTILHHRSDDPYEFLFPVAEVAFYNQALKSQYIHLDGFVSGGRNIFRIVAGSVGNWDVNYHRMLVVDIYTGTKVYPAINTTYTMTLYERNGIGSVEYSYVNTQDTALQTQITNLESTKANQSTTYTKTESDTTNALNKTIAMFNSDIANYYTKTQIDSNTPAYITNSTSGLTNYYTKTQNDATNALNKTIVSFNTDIANYYTKTQIDSNTPAYITNSTSGLTNYYTKTASDVTNALNKTIVSFNTDIANYYTKTQIDSNTPAYITNSTSGLTNYYTKTENDVTNALNKTIVSFNTDIANYVLTSTLTGNYATIATNNANYAPTSRFNHVGPFTYSGQGAYLGWNLDGGGGKTYFSNFKGGGYGGFIWQNYDNAGNLINEAMNLDVSGNLTTLGTINCTTLTATNNSYIGSGTGQAYLTSFAGDFYIEVNGGSFKINQWMPGVNLFTVDHATIVGNLNGITPTQLGYLTSITSNVQTQLNTLSGNLGNYLPLLGGSLSGNLNCNALLQRLTGGNIWINMMNTSTGYVQYMTDTNNSVATMVLDVQTSAVVTGGAPTITSYTIHPPITVVTSINGITPTQLGYLNTLSSNIQTQLNTLSSDAVK